MNVTIGGSGGIKAIQAQSSDTNSEDAQVEARSLGLQQLEETYGYLPKNWLEKTLLKGKL